MKTSDLRIALFSGNYNYVRDGANQALNLLVDYLLRQGAKVRVYAPTTDTPAFEPTGDLISVPSIAIPGRDEYRIATGMPLAIRYDLKDFAPNMVHIAAPDILGHRAIAFAEEHDLARIASVHTRFETYPRYYGLAFLEPAVEALLQRLYQRCDALVAPSQSMADILTAEGMNDDITLWQRGVDADNFNPKRRDNGWRRGLGIADDEIAIGFLGRLVMEKGLDVFCDTIAELKRRGVPHRVLVIGDGPAGDWFRDNCPEAVFAGFQGGRDLGRAVAAMDIFFNPSETETFGNVTLEAMACGVAVVGADATGTNSLVKDGVTGRLVSPRDVSGYADAIEHYVRDAKARNAAGKAGHKASLAYSWDAINQAVVDTYLRVLARRGVN